MLLRNNDKFQRTGDADSFLEMKQRINLNTGQQILQRNYVSDFRGFIQIEKK